MTHPIARRALRAAAPVMLGLGVAAAAAAEGAGTTGDAEAGRDKSRVCAGCHGPEGMGTLPRYPNLAGQQQRYLADSITAYRDGGRTHPEMAPMAANLSDRDIADLAAFYASRPRCPE